MPGVSDSSLSPSFSASAPICADRSIADVVLPRHLHRVFSYRVPAALQLRIQLGSRVLVPFGHTDLPGMVVAFRAGTNLRVPTRPNGDMLSPPLKLREIKHILDEGKGDPSSELLILSRLVSEYYLAPWGQCIRLIVPPSSDQKRRRYRLTETGREALHQNQTIARLSSIGRDILLRLERRRKGLTIETLRHSFGPTLVKELARLKRHKVVEEFEDCKRSASFDARSTPLKQHNDVGADGLIKSDLNPFLSRTSDETAWWEHVLGTIRSERTGRFLVQGPREHRLSYAFELTDYVITRHRRTIMIASDIAQADALAALARRRWGNQVAIIHSGLSPALRKEHLDRLGSNAVKIVIGTRSAIFVPLASLGLVYVDEENSSSLKEETEPQYHARDVAWMRAQLNRAVMLLGSSHASLESIYTLGGASDNTSSRPSACPALTLHSLQNPASITLVDLRQTPYGTLISDPMLAGIRTALDRRMSIILYLNRKGFSTALACHACGHSPQCPHCNVALKFHKQSGRLSCHYCSLVMPLPETCPACHAAQLRPSGIGTEAVEEQVRRLFPLLRIARLDGDTAATGKQADSIRGKFVSGEIDILIGTQMLLQGKPFLKAGFVGLVHADAGLHLPDFRAGEQTYHTLLEAVALARPKEEGGQVVLQTLLPTHSVIRAVSERDPDLFYKQELAFRQALGYPPFSQLISLRVTGSSPERTQRAAEEWKERLQHATPVTVWGPLPSPVAKLREKYRWQILVKSADGEAARRLVHQTLADLEMRGGRNGIKFEVDVDPISLY